MKPWKWHFRLTALSAFVMVCQLCILESWHRFVRAVVRVSLWMLWSELWSKQRA
jgi:hypothetical protein